MMEMIITIILATVICLFTRKYYKDKLYWVKKEYEVQREVMSMHDVRQIYPSYSEVIRNLCDRRLAILEDVNELLNCKNNENDTPKNKNVLKARRLVREHIKINPLPKK